MPYIKPYQEKNILQLVSSDDEQAFRQLFNIYHNKLAVFVFRFTKSQPITQELVQDVFVKVWLHRGELNAVQNFESWMYAIARNHVFNHLKKIAREYEQKVEWQEYEVANLHLINAETENVNDPFSLIEQSIEKLPPQQKKVLLLKRREGMKNEDIARQMNLSLETVKKHFALAMRFLRNHAGQTMELLIMLLLLFLN